jgi:hypothetical protein
LGINQKFDFLLILFYEIEMLLESLIFVGIISILYTLYTLINAIKLFLCTKKKNTGFYDEIILSSTENTLTLENGDVLKWEIDDGFGSPTLDKINFSCFKKLLCIDISITDLGYDDKSGDSSEIGYIYFHLIDFMNRNTIKVLSYKNVHNGYYPLNIAIIENDTYILSL